VYVKKRKGEEELLRVCKQLGYSDSVTHAILVDGATLEKEIKKDKTKRAQREQQQIQLQQQSQQRREKLPDKFANPDRYNPNSISTKIRILFVKNVELSTLEVRKQLQKQGITITAVKCQRIIFRLARDNNFIVNISRGVWRLNPKLNHLSIEHTTRIN